MKKWGSVWAGARLSAVLVLGSVAMLACSGGNDEATNSDADLSALKKIEGTYANVGKVGPTCNATGCWGAKTLKVTFKVDPSFPTRGTFTGHVETNLRCKDCVVSYDVDGRWQATRADFTFRFSRPDGDQSTAIEAARVSNVVVVDVVSPEASYVNGEWVDVPVVKRTRKGFSNDVQDSYFRNKPTCPRDFYGRCPDKPGNVSEPCRYRQSAAGFIEMIDCGVPVELTVASAECGKQEHWDRKTQGCIPDAVCDAEPAGNEDLVVRVTCGQPHERCTMCPAADHTSAQRHMIPTCVSRDVEEQACERAKQDNEDNQPFNNHASPVLM